MNLEKLKDSARKFEQKEDWRRAIEVYLKAIEQIESGAESSPDLSLYNRVGDLYLKTNDTAAAVRSYERAVDLYADQGFFNNAIALCGKILRVNPGRTQTYLKLAQLHARKNVVIEAKRNLIEFLERMNALGQLEQAFGSVKLFADQFSGSQEIRIMLVELLRAASRNEEAREQLEKLAGQLEAGFERPAPEVPETSGPAGEAPPEPQARPAARGAGLVFLDTGFGQAAAEPPREAAEAVAPTPVDGLIPAEEGTDALGGLPTLPGLEQTSEAEIDPDGPGDEREPLEGVAELIVSDEELVVSLDPEIEVAPDEPIELDPDAPPATAGLPLIEVAASVEDVAELESRVLDDPDDPDRHRRLADALLAAGDEARGLEELELGLLGFEEREEWERAAEVVATLVRVEPDNIRYHQKQVELAFRTGDRAPLLDAYLSLGDALARVGAREKAIAVYGRVREHDPDNAHAVAALEALESEAVEEAAPPGLRRPAPPAMHPSAQPVEAAEEAHAAEDETLPGAEPAEPPADAFVDFGSLVLEEEGPRDTRMKVDRQEPQDEDQQREFQEILEQFKRGLEQNLESDDFQARYDLGIAFKEMGLLDEAIAEFQRALRAPEGRLRTSEALGQCFYEKGQHAIAETVLRRAVETIHEGDEAKIGLLYWLGRAAEAQGKAGEAIGSYERAMAVDIRFMDVGERIHRLTAGRQE